MTASWVDEIRPILPERGQRDGACCPVEARTPAARAATWSARVSPASPLATARRRPSSRGSRAEGLVLAGFGGLEAPGARALGARHLSRGRGALVLEPGPEGVGP